MTWKELEKMAIKNGWKFVRHGSKHDIYIKNGIALEIERHRSREVRPGIMIKLLKQINNE